MFMLLTLFLLVLGTQDGPALGNQQVNSPGSTPTVAERAPEGEGFVVIRCRIGARARVTECEVVEEQPTAMGFGAHAVEQAVGRRVSGARTGAQVRWTVRYRLED